METDEFGFCDFRITFFLYIYNILHFDDINMYIEYKWTAPS